MSPVWEGREGSAGLSAESNGMVASGLIIFFWRVDMEEKQMNAGNSVMSIIGLVLLAESAAAQEKLMGITTISRKRMDGFPS